MAMIECVHCGKPISDKAKVCPHCNEPLIKIEETPTPIICEECGAELPFDFESDSCPTCGCPIEKTVSIVEEAPQKVEVTGVSLPKMEKSTKKTAIIVVGVVVLALIIGLFACVFAKQKAREEYADNLYTITKTMITGAAQAEECGNLIKRVWSDAIYEDYDSETYKYTHPDYSYVDFNTALSNLFDDPEFNLKINMIESNQRTVASLMKDLKNPPEEYETTYEALKDCYDAYTTFTEMVVNPTGSLQTYSQSFNTADSEMLSTYKALLVYVED